MRARADWLSRKTLALAVVVAALVTASAALGAWAGGVIGSASPSAAKSSQGHRGVVSHRVVVAAADRVPARAVAKAKHAARPLAVQHRVDKRKAAHVSARRTTTPVTLDLCAKDGSATMADGSSVPIWGFVLKGAAADCSDVTPSLPGPQLDVNQGDNVIVNVTNALSGGQTISLEAPGVTFDHPGTSPDAGPGATATLAFTASQGTFLYESSGDAGRQEAMGLYGALIVHSATAGQAYGNAFDVEKVLVLSEIDPNFSADPGGFNMGSWAPQYWLINGKSYPDTGAIVVQPGNRLLVRYLNAGIDNNTLTMLGLRERLVARDAYPLTNPYDVVSQTFPSGETVDALITIPSVARGTKFPLYNRNLHLVNGTLSSSNRSPGGMMTFIRIPTDDDDAPGA